MLGVSLLCGGALLTVVVLVTGPQVGPGVVPFAAASVAFRLAYFALLAAAYERGPLSVVYPISRGVAPVLVLAVSVGVLGASLSAAPAGAVVLGAAGGGAGHRVSPPRGPR